MPAHQPAQLAFDEATFLAEQPARLLLAELQLVAISWLTATIATDEAAAAYLTEERARIAGIVAKLKAEKGGSSND